MQAGQQEHLQKLIDTSPILSLSEKAEWLDMLILMNDKQAGELEQILNAHHAIGPGATTAPATPMGNIPPLAHISNLPSGLGTPVAQPSQPRPQPTVAAVPGQMSWQKQFEATLKEKELPAGPPQASALARPETPRPLPAAAPPGAPSTRTTPSASPQAVASAVTPTTLETLVNVGALNLGSLRSMNVADLLIRLQQLSKMEGYFNVLSYLEDSPLYKSYIATGKQALVNASSFGQADRGGKDLLTKKEFETFADILRKIQLN